MRAARWRLGALGRLAAGVAAAVGAGAACDATTPAPEGRVRYVLDAPLCSSVLPVQFFIDSVLAGTDTFVVGILPEDTASRAYRTTPGTHRLGAQVVAGFVWPDTVVNLLEGEETTYLLPFYCS